MVIHLDRIGEGKGGAACHCVSHEQRVSQASLKCSDKGGRITCGSHPIGGKCR